MFVPNLTYPVSFPTPTLEAVERLAQIVRQSWPSLFPACESRLVSACRIASTPGAVEYQEFAPWLVASESRPGYYYNVEEGHCYCPDHQAHGKAVVCKHRFAIYLFAQWQEQCPRQAATFTPVEPGDLVTFDWLYVGGHCKLTGTVTGGNDKAFFVQVDRKITGFSQIVVTRSEIYEIDRPEAVITAPIGIRIPEYAEL